MEPLKSSSKLYRAVSVYFKRWNIDPAKGILIAASGGIDSTALMAALARYRDFNKKELPLHALYVNHNLRTGEEIEEDWSGLRAAARLCSVPVHRIDIPENEIARSASALHEGVEAAARRARYEALDAWLNRLNLGYIALGHTLDDLVETMIMRFFQGCGVSGLHGIPPLRGNRIRPLLEVSKAELEKENEEDTSGDISGKHGVEKYLDSYIRGRRGAELVEVNASGKEIKNLGRIDPVSGYNIVLNIDADLQKSAWEAFEGRAGAAVVLDPRDGAVLAMVSSPSFDPNLFNSGVSSEQWSKIIGSSLNPLSNRAISGQYPPGSTYKLIVAAAALEEGIVTPGTGFFCNGAYAFGKRQFRCWLKSGHGTVSLHRAIVESCDVYFYNVGRQLGVDKIAHYAKLFGLGGATGIDLPNEKSGLIPTKKWKLERLKQHWQAGETISISIGQGFDLVTPLQLASAYSALANGGILWKPRLVKSIETIDGKVHKEFLPEKRGELSLKKGTIDTLRRALWGVVNEPGGTCRVAARPNTDVCGKTGTAQVVSMPQKDGDRRGRRMGALQRDHALFVCFAPLAKPEIAIAVIAENAGHGGSVAGPIARKILDAYFNGKKKIKQPQVTMESKPAVSGHQ